jgi:lipoate-protein ligase A
MAHAWRLIVDPAAHGAWNMAVDESILEHVRRGDSRPTLRLYAWEPACLSLGSAQPFADVDVRRLKDHGWEVVRRPTGGRAILHTDELTYSVTAPQTEELVAGSLLESYNRLAEALLQGAHLLGLQAEMQDGGTGRHAGQNPVCFEVPSAHEITSGGKKLIGSAQARRQDGVLQHGSLPLWGDLQRITEALVFPDEHARAEAGRRLLRRATSVEAVLHKRVEWGEAASAVRRGFEEALGIDFQDGSLSASERERAQTLVGEKYGNPAWTERL